MVHYPLPALLQKTPIKLVSITKKKGIYIPCPEPKFREFRSEWGHGMIQ